MAVSPASLYADLVKTGAIERDNAQEAVAARLSALGEALARRRLARKSSTLGWLFGKRYAGTAESRGLYIYGGVGGGKTMLMDLFFGSCPVERKRRTHFHEFMLDVHDRLNVYRHKLKHGEIADAGDTDPVRLVACDLAAESQVLCFDEFHVTDIADAMILGRLFTGLFDRGVIVVATSNIAPYDLYRGGLNRALFVPFIDLITAHMEVVHLAAHADYRLGKLVGMKVWHVPADEAATRALDAAWRRLTAGQEVRSVELMVKGHVLLVPRCAMGAARFSFHDLCEQPLGAGDYLRLAREFHTIVIDHIPVMTYADRNEAKRFIALVDTLYDAGVKILASAAAEPGSLYRASDGFEVGEFERTASRLIEMGSTEYLARPRRSASAPSVLPATGSATTERAEALAGTLPPA
jgi:cell division protein ZapE